MDRARLGRVGSSLIDRVLALYYTKGVGGPGGYGRRSTDVAQLDPALTVPVPEPEPAPPAGPVSTF